MNELSTLAPNLFQIQYFNKKNKEERITKPFTYSGTIDSNVTLWI